MVFMIMGSKALAERVTLRLASDEKKRLQSDADLAGLSVSEIIRRHYFGRPVIADADAVMIKELQRMGCLMKLVHNESAGAYSLETSNAIGAIVKYIDALTAATRK